MKNLEFESIMMELGLKGDNKGNYTFAGLSFTFENGNLLVYGNVPLRIRAIYEQNGKIEFKYENDFLKFVSYLLAYYEESANREVIDSNFETVLSNFHILLINRIKEDNSIKLEDYNKLANLIHKSNIVKSNLLNSNKTDVEKLLSVFDEIIYSYMREDEIYNYFKEYDKENDSFIYEIKDRFTDNYILTIRGKDTLINTYCIDKDDIVISHVIKPDSEYVHMYDNGEVRDYSVKSNDMEYLGHYIKKSIFLVNSMMVANSDKKLVKKR